MSFFEGLTHDQISRRLKWPLGTVKTRIRAGMIQLRAQLANESDRQVPPNHEVMD
jgi:RNA polymerase sigma-70 factor (ECF subfamily)